MMNRKILSFFPLINVLIIILFFLSACQPVSTPTTLVMEPTRTSTITPTITFPKETSIATQIFPTATVKPIKITIWHQWEDKRLDMIIQAFKDYQVTHPNVIIEISRREDLLVILDESIKSGTGPDIIGWGNDRIGEQAQKGNIVSLNEFNITPDVLMKNFVPAAVRGVQWANKVWALPEMQEGIALVYNKDIVKDEFLPKDPNNFEDLLDKAIKFRQAFPGKTLICNQGFSGTDAYHVAPVFFGFGMPGYIDDTGKSYLNTPEAIKAAEWLVKISKVSLKAQSYDLCRTAFKEGKVGLWWTGPWAIPNIEEDKINYGILPMGKPLVGTRILMLTKNAVARGNAEIAIDIMQYYCSIPVQKKLVLVNRTIPTQIALLADPEIAKITAFGGFGIALNQGIPVPRYPNASVIFEPVGNAVTAIWAGSQKPEEALINADKAIQNAIKGIK